MPYVPRARKGEPQVTDYNARIREIQAEDKKGAVIRVRHPGPDLPKLTKFMRKLPGASFVNRRKVESAMRSMPGNVGYQCPHCWQWYPTPAARRDCRLSHIW